MIVMITGCAILLGIASVGSADLINPGPPGPYSVLAPGYFPATWFDMASRTQAEQPHWMTPLFTVTPRLEQELRYDQSFQSMQHGELLTNYGSGKGLELIP